MIDRGQLPAREIFRAYDIRGIVGETLTPMTVAQIGQAIGSEAIARRQHTIVVGRDGRLSSPELSSALAAGINTSGCDVIDIGEVPTPVLYYAANTIDPEQQSGVMITGSHNPPEYNGIKMMLGGHTLAGSDITALHHRLEAQDLALGEGDINKHTIDTDYVNRIVGDIKLGQSMKVVIDCGNGVAGKIAPTLFKQLGCDVVELFCEVDGQFPNHHPNPSEPENLQDLIAAVKQHQADIGLAFDGDGDRLGIVTPAGDIIWPDRQMILFAQDILARHAGAEIIFDVKCSRTLPAAIKAAGGVATMWKTGHSFMKAKLKSSDALLAGEMSGHIFFKERWYGFDDGLYTGARLLEILSQRTESAQTLFDALPNTINTPELHIQVDEGQQHTLVEKLIAAADFKAGAISTIDGLRVDFADGFGLIRASNTTPVLVLRFEGDTQAALTHIQSQFRALLQHCLPNTTLPF